MLPNLSRLRVCQPVGTPLPKCAKTLIDVEECHLCNLPLGQASYYGEWTGDGPNWIVMCVNHHIVHKMCLRQQLTTGNRITECSECRQPIFTQARDLVDPPARNVRPRSNSPFGLDRGGYGGGGPFGPPPPLFDPVSPDYSNLPNDGRAYSPNRGFYNENDT